MKSKIDKLTFIRGILMRGVIICLFFFGATSQIWGQFFTNTSNPMTVSHWYTDGCSGSTNPVALPTSNNSTEITVCNGHAFTLPATFTTFDRLVAIGTVTLNFNPTVNRLNDRGVIMYNASSFITISSSGTVGVGGSATGSETIGNTNASNIRPVNNTLDTLRIFRTGTSNNAIIASPLTVTTLRLQSNNLAFNGGSITAANIIADGATAAVVDIPPLASNNLTNLTITRTGAGSGIRLNESLTVTNLTYQAGTINLNTNTITPTNIIVNDPAGTPPTTDINIPAIPAGVTLGNLRVDRRGMNSNAILNSNITVTNLTLQAGDTSPIDLNGNTITPTNITINDADPTNPFSGQMNTPAIPGVILDNLTINRLHPTNSLVRTNSAITTNNLNIQNGDFTSANLITIASGGTITAEGSGTSSIDINNTNIAVTNNTLGTLSIDGRTVDLDIDLTVNNLTIQNGTLDLNGNTLTVRGNFNQTGVTTIMNAAGSEIIFLGENWTDSGGNTQPPGFSITSSIPNQINFSFRSPAGSSPSYNVTLPTITTLGELEIDCNCQITQSAALSPAEFTLNSGTYNTNGQNLRIGTDYTQTGGTFNLETGNLMLVGTGFDPSGGTFNGGTGMIRVTNGDLSRGANFTFNPGTSTVQIINSAAVNRQVTSSWRFHDFTLSRSAGANRAFIFSAGETITVGGDFEATGTSPAGRLDLMSSLPGQQWRLDTQGIGGINFVSVRDSNAAGSNVALFPIIPAGSSLDVMNLGNNLGWFSLATPLVTRISAAAASDPTGVDNVYSDGDQIRITFNEPTNQAPTGGADLTKADVDALFTFTPSLGADYTGAWEDESAIVITVQDTTGSPISTKQTPEFVFPQIEELDIALKGSSTLGYRYDSQGGVSTLPFSVTGSFTHPDFDFSDLSVIKVGPTLYRPRMNSEMNFMNLPLNTTVEIYDLTGRRIYSFVTDRFKQTWNVRTSRGLGLGSGVYTILFRKGSSKRMMKFVVIR